MRRLVVGGWLRRREGYLTGSLVRAGFAQLDQTTAALVEGRAAHTRDRGMTVAERVEFAQIKASLESEGQK